MGMLIEGKWIDDDEKYRNAASGAFVRPDSKFRKAITADGSSGFKAEPGRYHLFLAPNCPWAHRTQIVRRLKRLEDVISVTLADLPRKKSWAYSRGIGRELEPIDGVFELYQAYLSADPKYSGRVTVPTLWDKKQWTVVNNESSEIIRMLNTEFDQWGDRSVDLYPKDLRPEIDALNERIYLTVNNGVYRCGFAKTQAAYEEAYHRLFETLEFLEGRLASRRYLCGDRLTEADWRLYVTLVRFDFVYYSHFKCNKRRIKDMPNLFGYLRDLYQYPGVAEITDIPGIKSGYYGSMPNVNPSGVVPLGPEDIDLTSPHGRAKLAKAA
jgi:putative glutathione S-transferase